jgi:hypothetical protein
MTFRIESGSFWNLAYLDAKGLGEEMPETIGNLSTRYSGFCELARRGGIYRQTSVIGKIHIDAFVDGETKAFGKNCWKH